MITTTRTPKLKSTGLKTRHYDKKHGSSRYRRPGRRDKVEVSPRRGRFATTEAKRPHRVRSSKAALRPATGRLLPGIREIVPLQGSAGGAPQFSPARQGWAKVEVKAGAP